MVVRLIVTFWEVSACAVYASPHQLSATDSRTEKSLEFLAIASPCFSGRNMSIFWFRKTSDVKTPTCVVSAGLRTQGRSETPSCDVSARTPSLGRGETPSCDVSARTSSMGTPWEGGETSACAVSARASTKGPRTDPVVGPNTPENGNSSGRGVRGTRGAPSESRSGVVIDPASLRTSSRRPIVPACEPAAMSSSARLTSYSASATRARAWAILSLARAVSPRKCREAAEEADAELLELCIMYRDSVRSTTGVVIAIAGTAGAPSCDVSAPGWAVAGRGLFVGAGSTIVDGAPEETTVSCEDTDCSEVGTEKPVVVGPIIFDVRYRADVCSADTADNL